MYSKLKFINLRPVANNSKEVSFVFELQDNDNFNRKFEIIFEYEYLCRKLGVKSFSINDEIINKDDFTQKIHEYLLTNLNQISRAKVIKIYDLDSNDLKVLKSIEFDKSILNSITPNQWDRIHSSGKEIEKGVAFYNIIRIANMYGVKVFSSNNSNRLLSKFIIDKNTLIPTMGVLMQDFNNQIPYYLLAKSLCRFLLTDAVESSDFSCDYKEDYQIQDVINKTCRELLMPKNLMYYYMDYLIMTSKNGVSVVTRIAKILGLHDDLVLFRLKELGYGNK